MSTADESGIVFVVDDDPDIRSSMEISLTIQDYRVEMFESGEAFFNEHSKRPGCLLLDLNLAGGMNGLEVQAQLKERGINIPIIFITGHGGMAEEKIAMEAGAIAFLQKPFDPKVLFAHIETALSQSSPA